MDLFAVPSVKKKCYICVRHSSYVFMLNDVFHFCVLRMLLLLLLRLRLLVSSSFVTI